MRHPTFTTALYCVLSAICLTGASHADNLTTISVQGSTATVGWNAAIWQTNGVGPLVGPPVPGNTYACVSNGVVFAANSGNTTIRNPFVSGQAAIQTFPGDSLTLNTNTEIRFKRIAAGNVPICDFPGVGGNPGLILNGGVLNPGDDDNYPVTGRIRVDAQSYLALGGNAGQAPTAAGRRFTISAKITGSGNLVFMNGSNFVAQVIAGTNETYSGQWIVKSALLRATGPNSLGTNSSILLDPNYVLPLDPGIVNVPGPAELEVSYDVNSAGTLTFINGGMMRLHQNCTFTAVVIEGTALSAGTHFYSELITNFPTSFAAGGSGSITVQPFGTPPALAPSIATQPQSQMLYAGKTARFTSTGAGQAPLAYRWLKGGVGLSDGGNLTGTTSTNLIIANVSVTDAAGYSMVVSNAGGAATSSVAALTIVSASGEAYEAAVLAANPVAFYQLNETEDPATNAVAFDFTGGYAGPYGIAVQNGAPAYNVAGPRPTDGFPGFAAGNKGAQFLNNTVASRVSVAPWNFNTNTVTITAWINPAGPQTLFEGLVFCRGGGTVAGLNYSGTNDINGNFTLGYTWNNEADTYNWDSGLVAPPGQWSLVALVVTPTNATIHVLNTNGWISSSHAYNHIVQTFAGTTLIGDDSNSATGARAFSGKIDDVAAFNTALSASQVAALYTTASGVSSFNPAIGLQPLSQFLYVGQNAQFYVGAGGSQPLSYRWRAGATGSGVFTNLNDGGRISGSTSATLTISNIAVADGLDYIVVITNSAGSITSSIATLTISPTSPAEIITMSVLQAAGLDWETGASWSDGNPASVSSAAKPGSTYELLAGARLRTPLNPVVATFPGNVLTLNGDGVWVRDPVAGATISEIRFKQPTFGSVNGVVNFKKLVMKGGQLDAGNDGLLIIGGEINVLTNAPINNDSGNDRGYRIDAWLTGNGNIEYHGYNQATFAPAYTNNLNIAGTSNTFSGKWNLVIGTLLGTGTNSLGTNDITVGAQGALETTYDLRNTNGNLFLIGRMFLHQNDTFRSVFIGGVPLAPGTYTFAQLSSTYSNNFPATWTPQNGATSFSTGSGSITVLVQPAPVIAQDPVSVSRYPTETAQFSVLAQGSPPLFYQWRKGGVNLSDTGNVSGSATTNLTITNLVAGNAGNYDVVVTNSIGSVTSKVATLTVLPTLPAESITMSVQQPAGNDWNTAADWSDGLAASVSALAKPGSTYAVLAGGRFRTPVNLTDAIFPGNVLTLEGSGVFVNNNDATLSEIRFKHAAGGIVRFKRLVMNGGQLDSGDNGLIVIAGRMDILANTPIYADNAAGQDRPYRIDAWLTGSGGIEYHAFDTTFTGPLNIAGTSNTFSGTWHAVQGLVLGTGASSLGTNDITVDATGALETTYNINNPNGSLILNGLMFLHQTDTFKNVTIGGVALAPGTYTFAQLTNAYPANFPATWTPHLGAEAFSTGSGSITVLGSAAPPVTLQFSLTGSNLKLTWSQGILLEADEAAGPWTTNTTAVSPFTVTPTLSRKFYRIQVQ